PAGVLDPSLRLGGERMGRNRDLLRDLPAGENFHEGVRLRDHALVVQDLRVDGRAVLEKRVEPFEIDRDVLHAERILEAELRQPPLQRHLTALEAGDVHATGARLLPPAPATGCLAQAGTPRTA